MFRRILLLSAFIISLQDASTHPVHVSVVNITIEGVLLNVTLNTFVDDWETAYFHYYGKSIQLKNRANLEGEWFNEYFQKSFRIGVNTSDTVLELVKDTVYFNDLSMTIEMHAKLKDEPNSLYIYNAILTDIFADQTNLLIYSTDDKENGIRFDYYKHEEELILSR
jgi:hypothetical protein